MRAVRFHQHGGPDVLRYEEAPDPVALSGGVLVRVRACALNYLDLWQRNGIDRVTLPMPHISGADIAGEIVAIGDGVRDRTLGQRVMLQPGLSCGVCRSCLAGRDNYCASYDVLGLQSSGGYAELVAVPNANVIPLPDDVDFVTAAAFPLSFLTAWHMLFSRAQLRAGDTVLVLAAGSGVGQAAIQLAKWADARVIATAGGAAKLAHATALGADDVVDHYAGDVLASVKSFTSGRGVDVVIEHVGAATWDRSVRALARGGRVVTCGATTGYQVNVNLRHLFARQLSLLGSYMGGKPELLEATALFFQKQIRPIVDRVFPLAEAAQAQQHLASAAQFGKVVLTV